MVPELNIITVYEDNQGGIFAKNYYYSLVK